MLGHLDANSVLGANQSFWPSRRQQRVGSKPVNVGHLDANSMLGENQVHVGHLDANSMLGEN